MRKSLKFSRKLKKGMQRIREKFDEHEFNRIANSKKVKCLRCGHTICPFCKDGGLIWCDRLLYSLEEGYVLPKDRKSFEPPYKCCGGRCVIKK